MTEYLFNAPWWLPVILGLAGAALFLAGTRRRDRGLKTAGAVAASLGAAAFLASYFVQTPVEKALDRTRRLVAAADEKDWATFESLLHPQTSFASLRGPAELMPMVKNAAERFSVKDVVIISAEAQRTETVIVVDVVLRSVHEALVYNVPVETNVRFEWQQREGEWLLYRIEPLPGGDVSPDQIDRYVPNISKSADAPRRK